MTVVRRRSPGRIARWPGSGHQRANPWAARLGCRACPWSGDTGQRELHSVQPDVPGPPTSPGLHRRGGGSLSRRSAHVGAWRDPGAEDRMAPWSATLTLVLRQGEARRVALARSRSEAAGRRAGSRGVFSTLGQLTTRREQAGLDGHPECHDPFEVHPQSAKSNMSRSPHLGQEAQGRSRRS